jgi:hypothetical protein
VTTDKWGATGDLRGAYWGVKRKLLRQLRAAFIGHHDLGNKKRMWRHCSFSGKIMRQAEELDMSTLRFQIPPKSMKFLAFLFSSPLI